MKFNIKKMKKILICLSLFVFISLFSYTMEEDSCSFTEEYKQYICEIKNLINIKFKLINYLLILSFLIQMIKRHIILFIK